jgi:hypothetical protein
MIPDKHSTRKVFRRGTSVKPATIRYSASTNSATWFETSCVPALSIARRIAGLCWSRWSHAKPEIYAFLEAEGCARAMRLPTSAVLQEKISHLLTRPIG